MIKVGDVLEGYEVVAINVKGDKVVLRHRLDDCFTTWFIRADALVNVFHEGTTIPLTPKPAYSGAFGESVEKSGRAYWVVKQYMFTGRFFMSEYRHSQINPIDNVFLTRDQAQAYCDALNCLEIDLRENSVVPVDGVKQWSLTLCADGKLRSFRSDVGYMKLLHAIPWYKTKEEAEKHLPNADVIIKSLEVKKGINRE